LKRKKLRLLLHNRARAEDVAVPVKAGNAASTPHLDLLEAAAELDPFLMGLGVLAQLAGSIQTAATMRWCIALV